MTSVDSRASQIQVICSPNATPNSNIDLRLEVTFTDDGVTIMQPLTYRITIGNQAGIGSHTPDYSHAELSLTPGSNPTRNSVRLTAVISDSRAGTSLRLFSEDGKLVRTLLAGRPPAGRYALSWDRKDDAGRLLPAGVYYARLATGSTGATAKLVVTD
jgi:flagellar hook assembly protein FlgD